MAVVETLEVRFQADMGKLGEQLKALGTQVNALAQTLDAGRSQLGMSASGLIQSVAEGLRLSAAASAAPVEAGNMLNNRFRQSILSGQADVTAAARQISGAANFSNASVLAAARSAGAALGQGFANGIAGKYSAVMSAANRIATAAANRIRSALQIHSPSRVSFELGGFFTEGFADGIYASMNMAEQSAGAISEAARSAIAANSSASAADGMGLYNMVHTAVSNALGGTSIVIPLNVDGMKLGEASIQGINRVTRSTGRLMLEI